MLSKKILLDQTDYYLYSHWEQLFMRSSGPLCATSNKGGFHCEQNSFAWSSCHSFTVLQMKSVLPASNVPMFFNAMAMPWPLTCYFDMPRVWMWYMHWNISKREMEGTCLHVLVYAHTWVMAAFTGHPSSCATLTPAGALTTYMYMTYGWVFSAHYLRDLSIFIISSMLAKYVALARRRHTKT